MMNSKKIMILLFMGVIGVLPFSCQTENKVQPKLRVLIDTDANNEIDDQHALAYLFFNGNTFNVAGVTVNTTQNGGNIEEQYREAERVMKLCGVHGSIPLYRGANASFPEIRDHIAEADFDGSEAVNFIIREANRETSGKLILLPVGKLTNIALALLKDPGIAGKVRIVWLGSNYPEPGEYNLENDTAALDFILSAGIPMEMVTVRYDTTTGSGNVKVTREEMNRMMPGKGPVSDSVEGRHGGKFVTFGDYSVSLFAHCDYYGDPPARSLYDMTAAAILKNPGFGQQYSVPAQRFKSGNWIPSGEPGSPLIIWEKFDRDAIMKDFHESMANYVIAKPEE